MKHPTGIIWFRNDLRLHDNECLQRAQGECRQILPVYCLDPRSYRMLDLGFRKSGIHRHRFLVECLEALRNRLRECGSNLLIRMGHPEEILPRLARQHQAAVVYAQAETTAEELSVERRLQGSLDSSGLALELIWGKTLYHLDDIPYAPEKIPLTFKAFRKNTSAKAKPRTALPAPEQLPTVQLSDWGTIPAANTLGFRSEEMDIPAQTTYRGGETAALERLQYYTFDSELLSRYKYTRNHSLGMDYSSKLSVWLAHGCLSPRLVYHTVKAYEQQVKRNISTWWLVFELMWRDYFTFQSLRFGNRMFYPGGIRDREVEWRQDRELFDRWRRGRTGIPFLDAHLIELDRTGFMSNRGRVNAASFLAHDYRIDWRWGAAWFEHRLIDYDVCSNWLNWNMQATETWYTNPVHQAMKYDKKGAYTLHWLPELASLPSPLFHAPWLLTEAERARYGLSDYEAPAAVYPKWKRAVNAIKKSGGR